MELQLHPDPVITVGTENGSREHEAVQRLIRERALLCSGIALEPIPFLDLAIILPIHVKMVFDIGGIYGFELSTERAKEIALELAGTVAINYAARVATRSALKFVPVAGSLLASPLMYGTTFALGNLAERYFRSRRPELPALEAKESQSLIEQGKRLAQSLSTDDWRRLLGLLRKKS
jgi:uncharacterized protein (DUF697 family)